MQSLGKGAAYLSAQDVLENSSKEMEPPVSDQRKVEIGNKAIPYVRIYRVYRRAFHTTAMLYCAKLAIEGQDHRCQLLRA